MMETSSAKQAKTSVMAINGGSSSVKFALFEASNSLRQILSGSIERIRLPAAVNVLNHTCEELMIALLERGPPYRSGLRPRNMRVSARAGRGELDFSNTLSVTREL